MKGTATVFALLALALTAASAQPLTPDATWAVRQIRHRGDHGGAPFMVLDKRAAQLYVLDAEGRERGTTPVLLGLALGDESVPGIGERPLSAVQPYERTTPAGRFPLEAGINLSGEDILWVDYEAGVSLHRVRATNTSERRLQRLSTPTASDNRISYGCINVPARFYDRVIKPLFVSLPPAMATLYVLPETRPVETLFGPEQGRALPAAH